MIYQREKDGFLALPGGGVPERKTQYISSCIEVLNADCGIDALHAIPYCKSVWIKATAK